MMDGGAGSECDYDSLVRRNIEENRNVLRSLGLLDSVKEVIKTTRPSKKRVSVTKLTQKRRDDSIVYFNPLRTRRSSALLETIGFNENTPCDEDTFSSQRNNEKKPFVDPTFGVIEGVKVGDWWATRMECSAAGVHRPVVAGIHGKQGIGCYSIALSGGYEDDVDCGEYFTYTGSGGRDLKGTKTNPKNLRTAPQSKDQTFDGMNGALAYNIESKQPVRVIRGFKGAGKYAPEEGYRYDGLYSVEKSWMATGLSGFKVCKFALKRISGQDPPPWTTIAELEPQRNGSVEPKEDVENTDLLHKSLNGTVLHSSKLVFADNGDNKKNDVWLVEVNDYESTCSKKLLGYESCGNFSNAGLDTFVDLSNSVESIPTKNETTRPQVLVSHNSPSDCKDKEGKSLLCDEIIYHESKNMKPETNLVLNNKLVSTCEIEKNISCKRKRSRSPKTNETLSISCLSNCLSVVLSPEFNPNKVDIRLSLEEPTSNNAFDPLPNTKDDDIEKGCHTIISSPVQKLRGKTNGDAVKVSKRRKVGAAVAKLNEDSNNLNIDELVRVSKPRNKATCLEEPDSSCINSLLATEQNSCPQLDKFVNSETQIICLSNVEDPKIIRTTPNRLSENAVEEKLSRSSNTEYCDFLNGTYKNNPKTKEKIEIINLSSDFLEENEIVLVKHINSNSEMLYPRTFPSAVTDDTKSSDVSLQKPTSSLKKCSPLQATTPPQPNDEIFQADMQLLANENYLLSNQKDIKCSSCSRQNTAYSTPDKKIKTHNESRKTSTNNANEQNSLSLFEKKVKFSPQVTYKDEDGNQSTEIRPDSLSEDDDDDQSPFRGFDFTDTVTDIMDTSIQKSIKDYFKPINKPKVNQFQSGKMLRGNIAYLRTNFFSENKPSNDSKRQRISASDNQKHISSPPKKVSPSLSPEEINCKVVLEKLSLPSNKCVPPISPSKNLSKYLSHSSKKRKSSFVNQSVIKKAINVDYCNSNPSMMENLIKQNSEKRNIYKRASLNKMKSKQIKEDQMRSQLKPCKVMLTRLRLEFIGWDFDNEVENVFKGFRDDDVITAQNKADFLRANSRKYENVEKIGFPGWDQNKDFQGPSKLVPLGFKIAELSESKPPQNQ